MERFFICKYPRNIRYNVKSVQFWQLFFFILATPALLQAQSFGPGGVTGRKMWFISKYYKTEKKYKWEDVSGKYKMPAAVSGGRNINFHEAVKFDTYIIPFENLEFAQATAVGVLFPDPEKEQKTGGKIETNTIIIRYDPDNNNDPNTSMKTVSFYASTATQNQSVWKKNKTAKLDISFDGYIPELIVFSSVLKTWELPKIETYLAIKYGLTLDGSYYSSSSTAAKPILLWDINDLKLKKYHKRIGAIGRDRLSGLVQLKSHTTYEEDDNAYFYDSDGADDIQKIDNELNTLEPYGLVPANDSISLYRSLTIGLNDTIFKDNTFLFWGDDGRSIQKKDFEKTNFPNLVKMQRKWLLYNKDNIRTPTKIIVSGKLHKNLYTPNDYLSFRYLLLKLKGDTNEIDSFELFHHFGRVLYTNGNFLNNKMVWENVTWENKDNNAYHYFTFAKIPLLQFQLINDSKVKTNFHVAKLPVQAEIVSENLELKFDSKKPAQFDVVFSDGIKPYRYTLQKKEADGSLTDKFRNALLVEKAELLPSVPATPENDQENPTATDMVNKSGRNKFTIPDIEAGATYFLSITDYVNQEICLQINTKKKPAPTVK